MEHRVAVRTNRTKVPHGIHLMLSPNRTQRAEMMDVDETLADRAVSLSELEAAHNAGRAPVGETLATRLAASLESVRQHASDCALNVRDAPPRLLEGSELLLADMTSPKILQTQRARMRDEDTRSLQAVPSDPRYRGFEHFYGEPVGRIEHNVPLKACVGRDAFRVIPVPIDEDRRGEEATCNDPATVVLAEQYRSIAADDSSLPSAHTPLIRNSVAPGSPHQCVLELPGRPGPVRLIPGQDEGVQLGLLALAGAHIMAAEVPPKECSLLSVDSVVRTCPASLPALGRGPAGHDRRQTPRTVGR